MKKPSSIIFALFIFMTLFTPGCKKDDTYMNNAVILGEDMRLCVCCGGLEIKVENVQNPAIGFFLAGQLPPGFNLGDNPKYPIPVKIDWKIDSVRCYGNYITISKMTRR
jgi:hypothetical protein